ncbi:HIRAN domain-containing protein [Edaphobacter bradus]|uniref:HIRAN domain-containing protein n=1 Tax=Edaphobacter bradus TaxID=2259016 RepID=UPI0021E090C3|nr:HIRAN domain-containing protein [Edaphobacter bradus]
MESTGLFLLAVSLAAVVCVAFLSRLGRSPGSTLPNSTEEARITPDPPPPAKQLVGNAIDWDKVAQEMIERQHAHDLAFKEALEKKYGPTDKSFHTKIAGVSHKNEDGTRRRRILEDCKVGDMLTLIHEPDNPYDPNALAICTDDGCQLGYIERRLAGEIVRDVRRHGPRWVIMLSHFNHHPETFQIVGATLYVLRLVEAPVIAS